MVVALLSLLSPSADAAPPVIIVTQTTATDDSPEKSVTAHCPPEAPYPVGCSVFFSPGDDRGCVAAVPTEPDAPCTNTVSPLRAPPRANSA